MADGTRRLDNEPPVVKGVEPDKTALDGDATVPPSALAGATVGPESVLLGLDTSGRVGSAARMSLRRLAHEEALPEAATSRGAWR